MPRYKLLIEFEAESDKGAHEDALNAVGAVNKHNVVSAVLTGRETPAYIVIKSVD